MMVLISQLGNLRPYLLRPFFKRLISKRNSFALESIEDEVEFI